MEYLGLDNTLLGVDVIQNRRVVARDVYEQQLWDLIRDKKTKVVLTIIGGQGQVVSLDGGYTSFMGGKVLFVSTGGGASGKSRGSRAAQWMLLEQAISESGSGPEWLPSPLLTPAGRKALSSFLDGGTVVFSVHRASDILQVLAFSEKHGLKAVINGGTEAWKVANELAVAGVPVILNPLSNLPSNFE